MKSLQCWRVCLLVLSVLANHHVFAVTCETKIVNEWGAGFTAKVIIHNTSDHIINHWSVALTFPDASTIQQMWNATLSGSSPYIADHKSYNATIPINGSREFGFNVTKSSVGTPASYPELGGICSSGQSNHPPIADAEVLPLEGVIPLTINVDASHSTDPDGDTLTYLWLFGDGTYAASAQAQRTFTQAGTYELALTVNDGLVDSVTKKYIVQAQYPTPESLPCEYTVVEEWLSGFTASVSILNDTEYPIDGWSVELDFPDATTMSGAWHASVQGSQPYQVHHESYNAIIAPGQTVSFGFNAQKADEGSQPTTPSLGGICRVDHRNKQPVAQATYSVLQGSAPLTVAFDARTSFDPDNDSLEYAWNFGDDSSSTEVSPTKIYSDPGVYTVTLIVNDGVIDSEPMSFTITVNDTQMPVTYKLDADISSLYFVSTKKEHIVETHRFGVLSGEVTADGQALLKIDLNSVDTGIEARDQNLREAFFQTDMFSYAEVSLGVDVNQVASLTIGNSIYEEISPSVNLHGVTIPIITAVKITKLADNQVLVQNTSPLVLDVGEFNLLGGIEELKLRAGLEVISHAVPVNFTLFFNIDE